MMEFYFATYIMSVGTMSKIERELITELDGYMDRIISSDQLREIVEDLNGIQRRMLCKNKNLAKAEIYVQRDPGGYVRLHCGKCELIMRSVKGSCKEAAASETFNDGWWNCFDSFVAQLAVAGSPEPLREVCMDILTAAGVTSSEAFMRSETLVDQTAKDIAEYYANLEFID